MGSLAQEVRDTPVGQTIPAQFQRMVQQRGDAPALHFKVGDRWAPISWTQYGQAVARCANMLLGEGLEPGDRVAIWAANRPEWQIADLGAIHAGGVTVAIYQTLAPAQVQYLLQHSESRILILENRALLEQILPMRDELPALRRVIMLDGEAPEREGWVISWNVGLAQGDGFGRTRPGLLASRWQAVAPQDLASLIYTSGTTGTQKGVMLTHRNLTWTAQATLECLPGSTDDRVLSYLPLSHVLERVVSHLRQVATGCQIYFCSSIDQVMPMTREVHPTYFTSVPRLWEKIYAGIRARMDHVSGLRRLIRDWALVVAARKTAAYEAQVTPSTWVRSQWALADRLVYRKIRETLGFDQIRICVSGSAPVSPDILRFFYGLGVEILEGYGLTETTAPVTVNRPGQARFGTVGTALPGEEVRIAADGEILVRGPNVFQGYFRDPVATAEALHDGWLLTGDVGELDADGYLKITDRKKDLFKTSGGKYVAPGAIENVLSGRGGIAQAVVIGDARPFVTALITLDPEDARRGPNDPQVKQRVDQAIAQVNRTLSHPEQIKKWKILDGEFVVGDELTPKMSVRRKRIYEKYRAQIEDLYSASTG
ncbi:MAG: long-chain fatty acid--CoA ligase [Chloroflexi bacterium]|nr:MAG: long-chain fatty acid--CoA ligase [Chloroflexota bacterium]